MKKLFYTIAILFCNIITFAQDNKGTLVKGSEPVLRKAAQQVPISITPVDTTPAQRTVTAAAIPLPTGSSTEVGTTAGQLSVSLNGAATYTVPIAVPPGINGVEPHIALEYNSQRGNGIAGFGWNITGVSVISKIPSTKFHDGTIDPVDFDALDRYALDGQRLVLKNPTDIYGGNGVQYQTETFSNLKITSYGSHPNNTPGYIQYYGPEYFVVEYPDGSISRYGSIAAYGNPANSSDSFNWAIIY